MKDEKKKRFHIAKKKDIPDLTKPGVALEIRKKGKKDSDMPPKEPEIKNDTVFSWDIKASDGKKTNTEKKRKIQNKTIRKWVIVSVCAAAALAAYLTITLQTYTDVSVISQEQEAGTGRSSYARFDENILRCSRDGVVLFDTDGKELWKEDCQIQNPVVEVNKESAVVTDSGGNSILIFGKKGLKGEVQTELPIERVAVSEKGITAVILKEGNTPSIQCYDAAGNLLLEYKVSAVEQGYPVDLALSPDGTTLLVSYVSIKDGNPDTELVYYDFGNKDEDGKYRVGGKTYEDTVMPSVYFVSDEKSVAVGDGGFVLYNGNKPKEKEYVKISKEIKSICYDKEYLGIILKNTDKAGYELKLFDYDGKEVISKDFEGDYSKVKIEKGQVLMYDGEKCSIYTDSGVHRFDGKMGTNIKDIFPLKGINKYLVVDANGTKTVRLTK